MRECSEKEDVISQTAPMLQSNTVERCWQAPPLEIPGQWDRTQAPEAFEIPGLAVLGMFSCQRGHGARQPYRCFPSSKSCRSNGGDVLTVVLSGEIEFLEWWVLA